MYGKLLQSIWLELTSYIRGRWWDGIVYKDMLYLNVQIQCASVIYLLQTCVQFINSIYWVMEIYCDHLNFFFKDSF